MSPERLREIIVATGRDRRELARMLGYASENSLRQAEAGKQALPEDKTTWLAAYARMRLRHSSKEAEWLANNPPPTT
jgi:transcriptional regulator with XRE-family HTH domain